MQCIVFLVVVLKIWAFLHVFIYLSVMGRYNPPPIKTKLKYVKNAHIFKFPTQKKLEINAVHNLITFSIVLKNKNVFFNLKNFLNTKFSGVFLHGKI